MSSAFMVNESQSWWVSLMSVVWWWAYGSVRVSGIGVGEKDPDDFWLGVHNVSPVERTLSIELLPIMAGEWDTFNSLFKH
ncbi:putative membrane protein [Corynebacterium deserti GIMN1.010]|uniref:Putative membrane protein n=1 Tax=Corynebacterium deserti GIMN1.010 TaxID=931089 RepID=A0A0M4CG18_9CORY|nr:putative membrane protein [Corynebacterium deserti GIMN1.010]